ncbi:hypothetical protein BDZ89DRAFT_1059067 [Hymenopellis radicata]|nr:hypothetical protein BDZ89DRAFT_1059067 [Hymenopellis radicata]
MSSSASTSPRRWKIGPELGDSVTVRKAERITKLTKGEAANIISGLKHGAMAYHQKKAKAAAKSKQLQSKEKATLESKRLC